MTEASAAKAVPSTDVDTRLLIRAEIERVGDGVCWSHLVDRFLANVSGLPDRFHEDEPGVAVLSVLRTLLVSDTPDLRRTMFSRGLASLEVFHTRVRATSDSGPILWNPLEQRYEEFREAAGGLVQVYQAEEPYPPRDQISAWVQHRLSGERR